MDGNGDLTPEVVLQNIQKLTNAKALWVAFSGGLDSHVLLDLLVRAVANMPDFQIGALHIHHGISCFADAWAAHCEKICLDYRLPFKVLYVNGKVADGSSPEAVAREARFAAFSHFFDQNAGQNQALLLAHHETDQAETILLRLLRGSGPLGLGGIRSKALLGKGELIRPLLEISKEAIISYAKQKKLNWIEDDSNQNTRFDRNFLRREIMPLLNARWPHAVRSFNRAGELCFEAAMASEAIAAEDLETVKGLAADSLSVSSLLALERFRRWGVIRCWLQRLGHALPSRAHMERIDREVLRAKPGAKPKLKVGLYEIQRLKDALIVSQKTTSIRLNFEP